MRIWMIVLFAVGIGTAGGLHWWRTRAPSVETDVAESPEVTDDAMDEADVAPAPIEMEDEPAALVEESATAAMAAPPEVEVPGGATSETEAEARRNAAALVEQASKCERPVEQARLLTKALKSGALDRAADEKSYQALLDANRRGFLNPRVDDLCMRTEVLKGDSLWKICKRVEKEAGVRVAPGLIRAVNALASDAIYPGAKLKVPNVAVSILVEKHEFRLSVFVGDVLLKRYAVGLGANNRTPEGEFAIATRLKDPSWNKPGVGPIPPGDPENVLGTRWLGFAAKDGFPEAATFGIHGTRDDASIGTESSNGCVRMHNADVEELFEWIAEGVGVQIRP